MCDPNSHRGEESVERRKRAKQRRGRGPRPRIEGRSVWLTEHCPGNLRQESFAQHLRDLAVLAAENRVARLLSG
jgi:hypothetical protein